MLVVAVVLSIFLYHGMHPRNGVFKKSTKIQALITPIVWIAAGGFFATAVGWLSTVAKHASDAANMLGK